MNIAICLHGQPRDYKYGYNRISNLININSENKYDFFFHCWIDDNIKYKCSPWRKINEKDLFIENQNDVKNDISQLYKPISFLYEKPLDENKDIILSDFEYIKKSRAYSNTSEIIKNNNYNTYSQFYSRNKVKDLFEEYITNTKTKYDMVISTRFDGVGFPKDFKISNIQKNKIYASSIHRPRHIIPDPFLIIPPEIYINWFNFYKNIKNIINNMEIEIKLNNINEKFIWNAEEIMLSNYLFYGYNVNNIEYIFIET